MLHKFYDVIMIIHKLSDKTVFNQYDQLCQSDSKERSNFTTLGTYIILTEPPTKNNSFTATIYVKSQNYPPGHKIEKLYIYCLDNVKFYWMEFIGTQDTMLS